MFWKSHSTVRETLDQKAGGSSEPISLVERFICGVFPDEISDSLIHARAQSHNDVLDCPILVLGRCPVRKKFVIATTSQRLERKKADTGGDSLTSLQRILYFRFVFSRQRGRVLSQEFEDIVPDKIFAILVSDSENFNNTEWVKLDGEIGVLDHQILCRVSCA